MLSSRVGRPTVTAWRWNLRMVRPFCSGPKPAPPMKEKAAPIVPIRKRPNTPAYLPGRFLVPRHVVVPPHIVRPSYADDPHGRPALNPKEPYGECKTEEQIARMRRACGLAAEALVYACEIAKEGVSTHEVDEAVALFVIGRGAYPVGINYHGFPRGLCASVNECALHGVPNTRPLESGDIANFDVTVFLDGAYGDCSAMACIGEVDEDALELVQTTKNLLDATIERVGPGVKLNHLGQFSVDYVRGTRFEVVSEFCGHFIGSELHMKPNVLHVPNNNALELKPGMTFTIEPILIEGSAAISRTQEDGWTILSTNGGWSAQWEHTVLVTEHGAEVLTLPP